jgi:1-acyl-sn-glycerol-3-phosphate acyltransferase
MLVKHLFIRALWGIQLIFGMILAVYPIFICLGIVSLISIIMNGGGRIVRLGIRKALQLHANIVGVEYKSVKDPSINRNGQYLLLADFRSIIDITAILVTAPKEDTVTVIRKHNFYIPLLGWCLKAAKYIPFQRHKPRQMFKNLVEVMNTTNLSFVYFPRGHTEEISDLKDLPKNYLKLIHLLKLDVIPIRLKDEEHYKFDVIPRLTTTVNYGKPISFSTLSKMSNDEIHEMIFHEIYKNSLC